ncbi:MAG: hypothetical protein QF441_01370 [Bacteriovoracaceae bacterium]|nr:hypothetical protein [Halobacteriovoraceae bacterium]MDP7319221.1 hypothetical protein [Bacteriovoracaceae bacterium]
MRVLVCLLLIYLSSITALAQTKPITYDHFVSLAPQKQTQVIKLVHKFLAEFEYQDRLFKLEIDKRKKYHSYLRILNHFISQAHANDELFKRIPNQLKCYYAGWISFARIDPNSQRPKCIHPKKITQPFYKKYLAKQAGITPYNEESFKQTDIYKYFVEDIAHKYSPFSSNQSNNTPTLNISYQDNKVSFIPSSNNCNSNASIACNPDVYGRYKGQALCVTAETDHGLNASFLCNKALEKIEKDDPQEYQKMISEITQAGVSGDTDLFTIMTSMYDTCLCGGDANKDSPEAFNQSINGQYAYNIFQSRTCSGILAQTQLINEEHAQLACSTNNFSHDPTQQKWRHYLNKVNLFINEQIDEMRNQSSQVEGLGLKRINSNQLANFFKQDQEIFGPIAVKNFNTAVEQGLCPVLNNKPRLLTEFDAQTDILTVSVIGSEITAQQLSDLDIEHSAIVGATIASSTVLPSTHDDPSVTGRDSPGINQVQYKVTRASVPSMAKAAASYNGSPLYSNSVQIPAKEPSVSESQNEKLQMINIAYHIAENKLYNILGLNFTSEQNSLSNKEIEPSQLSLNSSDGQISLEALEELDKYTVKTPTQSMNITAAYQLDNKTIQSNSVEISPPELSCQFSTQESEEASILTIEASLPEDMTMNNFEANQLDYLSVALESESNPEFSLTPYEGTKNKFIIEGALPEDLTAKGEIKLADITTNFSCQQTPSSENPSQTNKIAQCSVKIEAKNENGAYTLSAIPSFTDEQGKTISLDDITGVSLQWYDLSRPKAREPAAKETVNSNDRMLEDTEEEVESNEETQEQTPAIELKAQLAEIENTAYRINKQSDSVVPRIGPIQEINQERKFAVIMKSKDHTCQVSDSYTIPKKYIRANNNNPQFGQPPNSQIIQPGGTIYGGQR